MSGDDLQGIQYGNSLGSLGRSFGKIVNLQSLHNRITTVTTASAERLRKVA